LLYLLLSM